MIELITKAKEGNIEALNRLFVYFKPMIKQRSLDKDKLFDCDLYQEQCILFVKCVYRY